MTSHSTLVELTADLPLPLVDRLVYGAYLSSHSRPVTLWLRGLSVADVRGALDGAVRDLGTGFAGVQYWTNPDPSEAAKAVRGDGVCVLATPEVLPFLENQRATAFMTIEQALGALETRCCFCSTCASSPQATEAFATA